jgi:hypothetical protein
LLIYFYFRYRATIEHTFGYLKRYAILSDVFRGKVWKNEKHLKNIVKILIHTDAVHSRVNPHRVHEPFNDDPFDLSHDDLRRELLDEHHRLFPPKERRIPHNAGLLSDGIEDDADDDDLYDSDNRVVNTEHVFGDFDLNDKVQCFHNGFFFEATITFVDIVLRTYTVDFAGAEVEGMHAKWMTQYLYE